MKKFAVVVTCLMTLAGSVFADTADDVVAWYRRYAELWKTAIVDIDAAAPCYARPYYVVSVDGVDQLMDTAEAVRSTLAAVVSSSKRQGWASSKLLRVKARVLNPGAAFVESEWTNFGADGTPLVGC